MGPRERDIEQWVAWAAKQPVDPVLHGVKRAEEVMRLREVGANNLARYGLTPRGKPLRPKRREPSSCLQRLLAKERDENNPGGWLFMGGGYLSSE